MRSSLNGAANSARAVTSLDTCLVRHLMGVSQWGREFRARCDAVVAAVFVLGGCYVSMGPRIPRAL